MLPDTFEFKNWAISTKLSLLSKCCDAVIELLEGAFPELTET